MAWDKADWKVWTHPDGDSWARCWIRLQETRESCKIVEQLLDQIPAGPVMAKVPRIIKVPEGEAWVSTENPLGEMGYYVVSKGDLGPFRVKIRSASFNNISIAHVGAQGCVRPRRHHDPRLASTSSSVTSIADVGALDRSLPRRSLLGAVAAARAGWARRRPAARRRDRLPVPVQDDVVHAEPARADGSRAVRLDAAARRSRQVDAEGRPRPGQRRRPHLPDGAAHRAGVDVPPRRHRAVRPRRLLHELRHRHLLRSRRVVDQRARHPHRRLGERQQVLAARRPACRRPADRLRTAARARHPRRRHPGRLDEPAGHRRRPEHRRDLRVRLARQPVHHHPVLRLRDLHDRGAGRTHASRRSTCRSPNRNSCRAT